MVIFFREGLVLREVWSWLGLAAFGLGLVGLGFEGQVW